jgi:hypothetical protein
MKPWEQYAEVESPKPWEQYATAEEPKPYSNNPLNKAFYNDMSLSNVPKNAKNLAGGLVRGAGSIGASLMLPADMINQKLRGDDLLSMQDNRERRQGIDAGLSQFGVDTNSGLYQTGKMGGEIAGTMGAGGMLGNVLKAGSKTPQAARLAESIASSGFTGANLGYKVAGGASQAALGGILIDPETAPTAAVIGGGIPIAGAVLPKLGAGIANTVGSLRTNTGGEPLKRAASVGMQGGKAKQIFVDNMRGNVPLEDVVNVAEQKLSQLGQQSSQLYKSGMVNIKNDRSILDFAGVDKSLHDAFKTVTYKGQIKDQKGVDVLQSINQEVANWKKLDPAEFHTPEGLDALKQKIGAIVEGVDPLKEKSAKRVANSIYNAIKGEITTQAPTYAKVMKDYSEGMDEINEIRKTLSVGGKSSNDTKLRKLQSIMRNNVNTNYGAREKLVNQLERGSGDISNAVAGQALNDWMPKGLGKIASVPTGIVGYGVGGLPLLAGSLATSSPRLMGETALKLGQGAGMFRDTARAITPMIPGLLNY